MPIQLISGLIAASILLITIAGLMIYAIWSRRVNPADTEKAKPATTKKVSKNYDHTGIAEQIRADLKAAEIRERRQFNSAGAKRARAEAARQKEAGKKADKILNSKFVTWSKGSSIDHYTLSMDIAKILVEEGNPEIATQDIFQKIAQHRTPISKKAEANPHVAFIRGVVKNS